MIQYTKEDFDRLEKDIGISVDTATISDIIPAFVRAMAIMSTVDLVCKKLNTSSPVPDCLRTMFSHNRKKLG